MWGRRTRRVQCLTQCSRWSSSPLPSSSSSSSTSSSSLTCSVPLLGDNHDDVGGLRRHLPNHLVWQADRRGTWSLLIYDQQFLTWFFSLFSQNFLTWAFFICYQLFVTQLISRCCSFFPHQHCNIWRISQIAPCAVISAIITAFNLKAASLKYMWIQVCAICGVLCISLPIPIIVNNFNNIYEKSKIEEEIKAKKTKSSWEDANRGRHYHHCYCHCLWNWQTLSCCVSVSWFCVKSNTVGKGQEPVRTSR